RICFLECCGLQLTSFAFFPAVLLCVCVVGGGSSDWSVVRASYEAKSTSSSSSEEEQQELDRVIAASERQFLPLLVFLPCVFSFVWAAVATSALCEAARSCLWHLFLFNARNPVVCVCVCVCV